MSFSSRQWRQTAAGFFSGDKPGFATTLVGILLKAYGAECLNWDPTTRRIQITEDFGVSPGRLDAEAIEALINAMTTDTAYRSVPVFHRTVTALSRTGRDDIDDVPDPEDLAWAVAELAAADPEPPVIPGRDTAFSDDIARYVGVVLDHYGIRGEPGVLRWAYRRSQPVASDLSEDPDMFEAAMHSSAQKADEVDQALEKRFAALLRQLEEVNIEPGRLR